MQYAAGLALSPHPEYLEAREALAGIDMSACTDAFEFGQNGRPHFIAGPRDSRQSIDNAYATLTRSCGEDNFLFTDGVYTGPNDNDGPLFGPDDDCDSAEFEVPEGSPLIRYKGEDYITNMAPEEFTRISHLLPR